MEFYVWLLKGTQQILGNGENIFLWLQREFVKLENDLRFCCIDFNIFKLSILSPTLL